ncbi:MAG: 16S rRNA (cytidine(1402)-2'-O)-methyltransferase [Candidatus Omnitrophica bacterium]|nr:16S rRNA (cytidine(1402)-2'-O)-methyltransferase [Candidatus Omnitrophota bacterium]
MAGTLSIVATPIGNLKDITLRAIDTLKSADLIACEDTRHASILLKTYDIRTPTTSYHSYSTAGKEDRLLDTLREGKHVALISDAGLPGISDPGAGLIQRAIAAHMSVTVIPGATAALAALVLSGFPTDRFLFEGFLPVKAGARTTRLEALRAETRTVVLYESPHRLLKTLEAVETVFGDIPLSVSRELTKYFEETRREPVSQARAHFAAHPPKGEFVIVIPPKRRRDHGEHDSS